MGFLKHFWYGCKLANISKSKLAMCYKGLKNIQNSMRNCMSEISAKGNREMAIMLIFFIMKSEFFKSPILGND